jgi:HTH-type transcriptional regulator / antitoxin HigA
MDPIRPIHTEDAYRAAEMEIERLLDAAAGTPDADRLELLSILVEQYENEHHVIDPPDPIDALEFRMDQMGLTRKDIERYLGSRGRVSDVLARKRPLSLAMIRALHEGLGIPAEVLIRPVAPPAKRRGAKARRQGASRAGVRSGPKAARPRASPAARGGR